MCSFSSAGVIWLATRATIILSPILYCANNLLCFFDNNQMLTAKYLLHGLTAYQELNDVQGNRFEQRGYKR